MQIQILDHLFLLLLLFASRKTQSLTKQSHYLLISDYLLLYVFVFFSLVSDITLIFISYSKWAEETTSFQ